MKLKHVRRIAFVLMLVGAIEIFGKSLSDMNDLFVVIYVLYFVVGSSLYIGIDE